MEPEDRIGRSKGIGGGAYVFTKTDLMKIPVLKISELPTEEKMRILESGQKMQLREFKTIFQELGPPKKLTRTTQT